MRSRSLLLRAFGTIVLTFAVVGCATADVEHVDSVSEGLSGGDIATLALANVGKGACSTNSAGGSDFDSSCTGNGGLPEYWCADFARWVWSTAGASNTSELTAAAGSFYVYGQNHGTLHSTPKVGDAVVFNYHGGGSADHVALVSQVNGDGSIETVSGDWNGESGTEAHFSSTSHVVLNAPAYAGVEGTTPAVMGMTISGFITAVGVSDSAPYGAKFVSQSFPYATSAFQMFAGQTLAASIALRNVGTKSWDAKTRLATTQPRDAASPFAATSWIADNRPAAVSGSVAPGASFTFAFDLHAPAKVGTYKQYFGVVEDGVAWFSDAGEGGPADDQLEAYIDVVAGVRGNLDAAACDGIAGWTQDQADPSAAIDVEVTFDGVLGGAGVKSVKASAATSRADLCTAIGSCKHGFTVAIPPELLDGLAHEVHAYGLAASGEGPNVELPKSPGKFTCAAPPADAGPATGSAEDGGIGASDAGSIGDDAGDGAVASDLDAANAASVGAGVGAGGGCAFARRGDRASDAAIFALLVMAASTRRRRTIGARSADETRVRARGALASA